jgi:hypothetical protein
VTIPDSLWAARYGDPALVAAWSKRQEVLKQQVTAVAKALAKKTPPSQQPFTQSSVSIRRSWHVDGCRQGDVAQVHETTKGELRCECSEFTYAYFKKDQPPGRVVCQHTKHVIERAWDNELLISPPSEVWVPVWPKLAIRVTISPEWMVRVDLTQATGLAATGPRTLGYIGRLDGRRVIRLMLVDWLAVQAGKVKCRSITHPTPHLMNPRDQEVQLETWEILSRDDRMCSACAYDIPDL